MEIWCAIAIHVHGKVIATNVAATTCWASLISRHFSKFGSASCITESPDYDTFGRVAEFDLHPYIISFSSCWISSLPALIDWY